MEQKYSFPLIQINELLRITFKNEAHKIVILLHQSITSKN
jgi:hypothetical protein